MLIKSDATLLKMTRCFFEISYNGSPYYGWQQQVDQVSVQEVIQKNLKKIFQKEEIEIVVNALNGGKFWSTERICDMLSRDDCFYDFS